MEGVSKAALFASGMFFGGAIDHALLAAMRRDVTPYGVKVGVSGNCLFALADLAAAAVLFRMHATRRTRPSLNATFRWDSTRSLTETASTLT
jgi:hypothetical protein